MTYYKVITPSGTHGAICMTKKEAIQSYQQIITGMEPNPQDAPHIIEAITRQAAIEADLDLIDLDPCIIRCEPLPEATTP